MDTTSEQEAPAVAAPVEQQFTPVTEASPSKSFTEDDLNAVRRQEKEKLYPEIDRLKVELEKLRADKLAQEEAEAARQAEIEAENKRKAEEEMDVRTLLQQKEQEWESKLGAEREERERALALLEKERQHAAVQDYRNRRLEEARETILPELIDLVAGENPDQIEQSIAGLQERSDRILNSAQQAAQSARRDLSGARVTAPPAEPLDNYSGNKSFTPDQLRNMSMDEYAQYRSSLLGDDGGRGLFG